MQDDKSLSQFDKWGVARPTSESHGTEEEIRANLKPARVLKWTLEGNKLTAETDIGPVVNYLPPDYIMRGIDDNGLPKLERIVL